MRDWSYYLFTKDDLIVAFNLFCTVCGIGTLGMPANFARAGPLFGSLAMLFMGATNIYASVAVSKVLLLAPLSVQTYGDLGEWCMGKGGRYAVVVSQMLVCTLAPTAFLVLGGVLLDTLFPHAFSQTFWIVFMALMVLPVCLTPTLKEGAGAAFAGCMGTLVADIVGLGMLLHGTTGHPAVPPPQVSLDQVAATFGNLALAYGAAIVIPSLQRHHRQPQRMPHVVGLTMAFISVLFIAMAWTGYSAVGCQISGNLLFNVFPDASKGGVSSLGMETHFGSAVMAFLFMQLHITIAFSVVLYPVFYTLERLVLGMHKTTSSSSSITTAGKRESITTSTAAAGAPQVDEYYICHTSGATPPPPLLQDATKLSLSISEDPEDHQQDQDQEDDYSKGGALTTAKYVALRTLVVAVLVLVAVVLQDKFIDLSDLVGASCITCCAIVLPIVFYHKRMGDQLPLYERLIGRVVVLVCTALGVYVTYKTGKNLFAPQEEDATTKFPFCQADHRTELYYIKP